MDFIEFNKARFVEITKSLMKAQHYSYQHLQDVLEVSDKTLGFYLNPKRPELPKLPGFTRLFQFLNSSPGYLLINRGPKLIDPASADRLFTILEGYADQKLPAYRVLTHFIGELDYEEVEMFKQLLQLYLDKPKSTRKELLSSFLNLFRKL